MDAEITADLEDRLTKIVRLVIDQPEAARHGLLTTIAAGKLTVSDIQIVIAPGERHSAMSTLARENRELRDELRRLRGAKGFTWDNFVSACGEHVDITRPRWRSIIASHLDLTVGDLTTYERLNRVPMAVLKQLESVPDLRDVLVKGARMRTYLPLIVNHLRGAHASPKEIKRLIGGLLASYDGDEQALHQALDQALALQDEQEQKTRASARSWSQEEYLLGYQLLRDKKGLPAVYAAIQATEGQINRKFNHERPEELFFGPIAIAESGPMSYLELWKIGQALFGETWKKDIVARFGMTRTSIQWDDPTWLSEAECAGLRHDWHCKQAAKSEEYLKFEAMALKLSKDLDRSKRMGWMKVFYALRDSNVELANDVGPSFAARFNAEHFELFDIRSKTRATYRTQQSLDLDVTT